LLTLAPLIIIKSRGSSWSNGIVKRCLV
jgi:hypothetical protein